MVSDYLDKAERFACVKAGALMAAGDMDAELGEVKEAAFVVDTAKAGVDTAKSLWILAALGAGVPLGVGAHVIGRRISGKRLREEELKEKIRLYQDAADEMAAGLGGQV